MSRVGIGLAIAATLLACGGATENAHAAGGLRITSADPAAVAGAAITVGGRGLSGRGLRVTIGGRRAKVTTASARRLTVVVPKTSPGLRRLVVRRGKRRASRKFRVLKAFDGTIAVEPDERRAVAKTIGPGGGTVEARGRDGTRYALAIPAGALARDEAIRVVPVARFTGVPFTGGRVDGVRLLPDRLSARRPGDAYDHRGRAVQREGARLRLRRR